MKLMFVAVIFVATSHSFAASEEVNEFTAAKWVLSDSQFPPSFIEVESVELPHNWNRSGLYGSGWYQIKFSSDKREPNNTWSVLLPQVIMNAQVWLNGHVIGSGGSLSAPVARHWHSPQMFSFPATLLKQENTLHIRVVAYTNQHAKLGKVLVGVESEIYDLFSPMYFKSVTLSIVSGVFSLLAAILLFAIWYKRRDSEYFWFAVASLMWSFYSINIFVINVPIPEEYWEKIVFLSSGWLAVSIALLLLRLDQKTYPKVEKVLLWVCIFINVVILLTPEQFMFSLFPVWLQFSFSVACCGIVHLAWLWLSHRKKLTGFILLMIIGIAAAGLHDVLVQSGWLDLGDGLWLDSTLPLFFIIISYMLVSRFIRALEEKDLLNLELENRVFAAGEILEQSYHKILFMEKLQATTNERERIHRDLHDSIGAKLLSLVYRSTNDSEAELARSALSDLRNLVHQAPVSEQSLLEAMYEWESSCVERSLEAGKLVDFHIYCVPHNIDLAKGRIHNLAAILTEALTNSLKHCDSSKIDISIRYRMGCLKFELAEYGMFGTQKKWLEGCGIKNMKYRVEQLNGKIVWKQSENINLVRWIFPIEVDSND